jgi:CRISPR/Cas system CMR-associated protein Cmr5 small subunit
LPTLAFLQSKTDKLYNVIEEYLKQKFKTGDKNIIEALADSNSSILRLATKEVMELSNWIRRLVKSES